MHDAEQLVVTRAGARNDIIGNSPAVAARRIRIDPIHLVERSSNDSKSSNIATKAICFDLNGQS